jgi:hypothetical protein
MKDPVRWVDRTQGTSLEDQAGALFRAGAARPSLSPPSLAQLPFTALTQVGRRQSAARNRGRQLMVAVALLSATLAAAAANEFTRRSNLVQSRIEVEAAIGGSRGLDGQTFPPVPAAESGAEPQGPVSEEELLLLFEAERRLTMKDPLGALAVLDGARQQPPNWRTAAASSVLRARALLQLGRSEEARKALEAPELQVFLLGEVDPCIQHVGVAAGPGALDAPHPSAETLFEDAAIGRARCLRQFGRDLAAQQAFEAYLNRYPEGRFVVEARRALR